MNAAEETRSTGLPRPDASRTIVAVALWWLLAAAVLAVGGTAPATAPPPSVKPSSDKAPSPAPLTLDDLAEPLPRERLADEREQDRSAALSLFGAGRVLEQRGEHAAALRKFERGLRRDPTSGAILEGIVAATMRLRREAELTRYARKAVDVVCNDVLLLSRLGLRLTEQEDWEAAAAVYEKVLAVRGKERETATDVLLRLELGKLYHMLDRHVQGSDSFLRAMKGLENPRDYGIDEKFRKEMLSDPEALYNVIGDCHLAADRPAEARSAYEKSHALVPDKPLLGLNLARVALKEKRPADAPTHLQVYFEAKLAKEGMAPYRVLNEALVALGRGAELIGRLEKLRADDPTNAPLGYFLAAELRQAKAFDKAEKLYTELLPKNPTSFGYRGLVGIYRQQQRAEPLLAALGQTLLNLHSLDALSAELKELTSDSALFDKLVDAARQQAKADPKRPEFAARAALAQLALLRKQFDVAGEFYRLAGAAQPGRRAEMLLEFGVGLLSADKRSDAIKALAEAGEKAAPETLFLADYYRIGALAAEKRCDEALVVVRKALERHKGSPRLEAREGWVLFLAKRMTEARQKLEALVKRLDDDHSSQDARQAVHEAKLLLSNIDTLEKRLPQAEQWLEQVLDEFPDDAAALNDLGYLWMDRGVRLEQAFRMVQRAVQDDPGNAAYRDSLGWAYYRLGQYPQAVKELEKAAVGDNPEGLVLEHLGDAYEKAQQPQKAREAWQRAARQFQKEGDAAKSAAMETKLKGK